MFSRIGRLGIEIKTLCLAAFIFSGCVGTVPTSPEVVSPIVLNEWKMNAPAAAKVLGCKRNVWQLSGQTLKEAIAMYSRNYVEGDCLILLPEQGGSNYYLGYAGQFGGCECGSLVSEWPGVPVYYLRDTFYAIKL